MQRVNSYLSGSAICRVLLCIWNWLMRQWDSSRIVRAFIAPCRRQNAGESSVFYRLWEALHRFFCRVFEVLHLPKITAGSIFRRSYLWCLAAVFLAPMAPTKVIILLAVVGFGSMFLQYNCDRGMTLSRTPINRLVILYAAVYLIAVATSVTPRGSLSCGLVTAIFVLYYFIVLNSVKGWRQLRFLLICVVAAGTLVALYGCYQGFTGSYGSNTWVDETMFTGISGRVYSTLQNPNVLAEYLLLVIPYSAAGVVTAKRWKGRAGFAMCFLVMCVCMVLTYSRGGWLGLLFAAAVFLIMLDRRLIWLGIVALVALYFLLPETVISRFSSIGNLADSSTSYRVSIWGGTLRMLKDYWLCGIGPGTAAFGMVYPRYCYDAVSAPHSHNLFLQITCDTGIVGLVIFILLIFFFFKVTCGQIAREKDRIRRTWMIASNTGVLGFLIQSMTDYSFYNYRVMLLFWVSLALGMLLCRSSSLPERNGA